MKTLTMILCSLLISTAHASYQTVRCSNSTGSVTWESGYDDNTIHLKYSNFIEGTLSLPLEKVKIIFDKEVVLKERKIQRCDFSSSYKVFAGAVKIMPADAHPDVLIGHFPDNRVKTEVICTEIMNSDRPCRTKRP